MLARKLSITLLLLAMLMSSTMLVLAPVAKCEGAGDPALLRLWADAGSYVGPNPDPWIHESWVVVGVSSFNLYIDAMLYPAHDVWLAVAVNDTTKITFPITIGSTTLDEDDFTYGEVIWPPAAGGGKLPRHGVYPTWYALAPFGDIDTGWGYQTYPWAYWAYRESIYVEIVATGPVKVHFDAQGVLGSEAPDPLVGKPDSCPFSHDLTVTPPIYIPPEATISGVKFHDLDANGVWDVGEEGLEGWTIELWFGGAVVDTDTTGAAGDYIFSVGIAGTYQIREVLEEGWMQTAPIPIPPGCYELDVELVIPEVHSGLNFGNIMLGSISGAKFDDSNANGLWDIGELAVTGWQVHLTGTDIREDTVDRYTTTGADGKFIFDNLLPGTYTVTEVFPTPPPTWMATTATSFGPYVLTEGEDYTGPDFGNIRLGSISGHKFYDANVNGEWDDGELPIEGWKVHLTGTNILGDTIDVYAFTDADGKFIFENLLPGSYTVEEVFPPAPPTWVPTTATSFSHDLEEGEDYVGPDFGNVCLMPGYGGRTLGFWTNKNGQALITSGDVSALNALNLYTPTGWTYPPFSTTLVTAKTQIRTYLLSATAKDMRWMLSAQLIATKLNVRHGFLSGSTIVYVGPSTYVPSGFITINDIMSNANAALLLSHPAHRSEQEYWKNLLDGVNNNRFPFVCPTPCPFTYP